MPASLTFQLPGELVRGDFTDPSGVNPALSSQSFPVSDLTLTFQGTYLTSANAVTTPMAEYQNGLFVGLSAAFNLPAGSGAYQQLLLSGGAATGVDAAGTQFTSPVLAAANKPYVKIDFTGLDVIPPQVNVRVLLDDDIITSVLITFTQAEQNVNGFKAAERVKDELKSLGLDVDAGTGTVTVWGKGDAKVSDVRLSVTQQPPLAVRYLPDVYGRYGATGKSDRNFPTGTAN
ncbi:hypothetical protein R5W23_000249 [Gemmata sp. JC673]|uniref:MBG domain-containing protein n=1 Tax=Gemmata algarum TaxID=2975278 RepID=A0ABU5ERT9_9BACT|nr:hypothetical protein [Gemmata algarum]MDY3557964.1 hypothetical protein [Gemmata algarum]